MGEWFLTWLFLSIGVCFYFIFTALEHITEKRCEKLYQKTRLAQTADQQHAWVLAGDPRGTYGEHYKSLGEFDHV
jgi:hypothetical protein